MGLDLKSVDRSRAQMPHNNYIRFFSLKNRCMVTAESELEYAGFLHFECDPTVKEYIPHPGKNRIAFSDGSIVGTIFDVYVVRNDGTDQLYEIKYEADLMKPHAVKQREVQMALCKIYDKQYCILTDVDLFESKAYYSNLKFLTSQHFNMTDAVVDYQAATVLDAIIQLGGTCKIGDIVDYGLVPEEVMDSICYLILYGYIRPDIKNEYISYGMEVSYEV